MRDPIQALLTAIERDEGGVAVVWCPDLGLREWLVGEVESLAGESARPIRLSTLAEALSEPARMVLLVPNDEREVVLDLDGSRDRLRSEQNPRSQPIVLFLLRDGDGQRVLAEEAMSLASWIGGSDADPEALAQIDAEKERTDFEVQQNLSPERWLEKWRGGELLQTASNFRISYRAMLLVSQ